MRVFAAADDIVDEIYLLTRELPAEEKFGLQAQIRRATVSVPVNIVEGSARASQRDHRRFLEMSLGSACEARYLVGLAARLEMLPTDRCTSVVDRYSVIIKALTALITTITMEVNGP